MREREWETAVRGPLASTPPDATVLVLVDGAAGTGKTRFVKWLLALPELGAMPRLKVTFSASGNVVLQQQAPLKGPASELPRTGAVRRPAVARPITLAQPGPAALAASSLGELAAPLEAGGPVLLVAENVHRADEPDAHALRTLLAHPPAGLRAVLTHRPEELARPGLVLGAPVGYPAEMSLVRLRLGPLDEAEVHRMAVEALGEDRCSAQFVTRLYERSGGIAQAVADLVTELKAAGALPAGPDAAGPARLTARHVDEAAVPVRLTELVVGRMAALDVETRRLVWAAAVVDEAATEDELASVAALSAESGRAALTAALSEAVLHELGLGRYGFRMPMEAAAVYQLLPGPVRRELHARAAEVSAVRRPVPWARLARHQFASGRIAQWLESMEKAASEAVESGRHQPAISLLEEVLAHPEVRQADRVRLTLMLARSAYSGLRSDQTVRVLRRLVDDPELPAAVRGEIRLDLGLLIGNQVGRPSEGRTELIRAVRELGAHRALAARAMSALALPYWPAGPLAENLAWLARAEATSVESGDAAIRAAVAANRVTVLLSVGEPDGWRELEDLPRESDDPRILHHTARGLFNAADSAVWLGEYTRVRELLAEASDLAARNGDVYQQQGTQGTALLLDLATGHWAGLAARARTFAAEAGEMPYIACDGMIVLGRLAVAKGNWSQMRDWHSGFLAGDDCPVPVAAATAGCRIRVALAREDTEGAAREAADAWARLRAKAVWVWAAELAPWAVEATVRAGESDLARDMVDEFAAGIESRRAPAATAALTWCRALLAEADRALPEAADGFRHARTRYQELPRPYEAALAAEAAGRCAVAGSPGTTTTGIAELAAAAHELENLGATWDLARVRAELRAHPGAERRPPGRPRYGERLSPREQEVAELAGAGLSNREIAATLHLSPRTVEQHVARALKKSGATSRLDLAVPDRGGKPGR
ncbi:DNA-binding response regulator, NarL/FixJ family, contains REC and HTH domains [Streptomyces sp. cf386]|uniref:ATP-binding protein n=1 Tax=Streptomyces sp. cf386 TaxID=1761904 RepID=UPI000880CE9F|nr:LuxR family transcriptional regulator [Streptomyces sp. cf386]SDO04188.1 DNA-binding response regulator, NarL/FixJ family, contains REC and HTH domains [Streptomyces sp. cf386]